MVETEGSLELNIWLYKNNITNCKFIGLYGHKDNMSIYGGLFQTNEGLLFQKHKWIEINKNKLTPKVCARTIYSHKLVNKDIFDIFKELNNLEYSDRYAIDMQSIK